MLVTLEGLVTPEQFAQLQSVREESYWEAATRRGFTSDDLILTALSSRFRMKIANIAMVSQQAKELVPEQLVRKYRVLPLSISDSVLDIATADPHDLDCERTLAFALGRTVRMALASPTKIVERIEELYRPENVVEKILEGVSTDYDVEVRVGDGQREDAILGRQLFGDELLGLLGDHLRVGDLHVESRRQRLQEVLIRDEVPPDRGLPVRLLLEPAQLLHVLGREQPLQRDEQPLVARGETGVGHARPVPFAINR